MNCVSKMINNKVFSNDITMVYIIFELYCASINRVSSSHYAHTVCNIICIVLYVMLCDSHEDAFLVRFFIQHIVCILIESVRDQIEFVGKKVRLLKATSKMRKKAGDPEHII